MLQRVKEVQESDLRMVGALARNIQRVIAVTQADIDAAAAQGKGWLVKRVVKVNDPLDNLRGGTQLVIKQNSIQPGQNVMRVLYTGSGKTVGPAVAPLSLPGAAAEDIMSLIAFGGTEQGGVPIGYKALNGVTNGSGTYVDTGITPTVDDIEIEIRVKPTTGSWYILQSRASGSAIWGVSGSSSGATILLGWGGTGTLCQSSITRDPAHTYYVKATMNNGIATLYVKDETADTEDTKTATYTSAVPTLPFWLYGNQNLDRVAAGNTVYMARIKVGGVTVMDYVPALNPSMVVGFYDKITGNFKVSNEGGTLTADQTIVPTPAAPIDIVCNNGVLKFTVNEANYIADNVTLGYWIRNNNGQPESSPANFYTAMMPVKPGVSYVCFGRNKETDAISGYNRIAWYDANGVWIRNSTYTQNQPGIDVAPSNAAFARFHCNINGTDVTQELVDSYNWVFQVGTAEVPYTPYSPTKVYAAGPIETIAIKDDQSATVSTATCEDLLSVGTYTDEQEIISGVVTKKIGIKVFDGTEDWRNISSYYNIAKTDLGTDSTVLPAATTDIICTHYETISGVPNRTSVNVGGSYVNFRDDNISTLAGWKQYLANQYAAGTPVIVIYPLATPTTDTVTPQPMQTAAGDNTAEITQAGMAGLELEVEYVEA